MIKLIFWAFMGYGMSTIIVYGSIFDKPRAWIIKHKKFLGSLIQCILCVSTWVGFFLSYCLGGITSNLFNIHWLPGIFFDGMFTTGVVWAINSVIEFFEENRINKQ